jgi:hypothetical protein
MTGLNAPAMNNNNTTYCIGTGGAIVAAQIFYAMPVIGIPQMLTNASQFNGQSVIYICATSVLKNEPFSLTTNPAC